MTYIKYIKNFLTLPFKGTSTLAGYALPMAIGAAAVAGAGIVYVGERIDQAETIMEVQIGSQSARTLFDQIEKAASSASVLKASAKGNNSLKDCLAGKNCAAIESSFDIEDFNFDACEKDDPSGKNIHKKGPQCAYFKALFPGDEIKPSNIASTTAGIGQKVDLYSSSYLLGSSKEESLISGFYNRYGVKCAKPNFSSGNEKLKQNGGCGKIYVATKFGIHCNDNACVDESSVRMLRIFYAVYSFQPSGVYKKIFMGSTEPAIANCEKGKYLAKITAKYGSTSIACAPMTLEVKNAYGAEKGERGDKGDRGPTSREIGPRGPRGPDETRYR